jgi:hypothetical protein
MTNLFTQDLVLSEHFISSDSSKYVTAFANRSTKLKKEARTMYSVLQKDIRKLIRDTDNIKRGLDILEHDYTAWAMQSQQDGLTQLIENLKHLEYDVSTMLSDCIFLGRQYWKDNNVLLINSLHQSFATMNTLFNDLKEVRLGLGETHSNPSGFQQLIIDWGRLKKSIDRTQRLVQHPQKRRKNHAWFSAVRQRRGGQGGAESVNPAPSQESAEPFRKAASIRQTPFQAEGEKGDRKSIE